MTDYLRLAQERAPQATVEQDNPYMPLAKQAQELGQNRARTVIELALKDDPEIAAERLRLSQSSGLPPDVVQRNLEELRVKERARAVDLVSLAQESPILYRQIVDPTFATTSIDDLDTLKNLERAVGKGVRYVMGADGKGGLPNDLKGAAVDVGLAATAGVGEMVFNMSGVVNDLIGWQSGAQAARAAAARSKEARNSFGLQPESSTGQAVKSGLQSSGTNLALLPLGLSRQLWSTATQAASAVAGVMAAGVGADAYNTAREKGLSSTQSLTYAIPQAGFEYVFERIPASKLFGDIAANTGLLKMIGRQTVSEGWTEQLTTLTQDFNEWMNLNQDKTLAQFLQERPEAAYQTFIATMVGVGVQTSTIRGINKVIETASNRALVFEQDQLAEQMALASQSLLRQRSPEQFRAHVQQVVEGNDGAKKEIYVDGEVLNQLPEEVLAQLPESVRAQIPEALELRSTVSIPMADVLTVAPGTELEQILNDNARMRPNAASRVEAQMAAELIQQEANRVLAQAADQTAWQQSSAAVQQTILEQLNAIGRFTPDVNEAYALLQANFFSSMASRLGITPQEMYQRYTLRAAAKGQGAGYNAGRGLTVEGFHYSKAARPVVSTAMFGTGLEGSNRDLYLNAEDKRLRKRAYFYVDKGTGINPESGVGGIAQKATLTNIYDADADPLRLKKGGQLAFESAVLDAGFSGYLTRMEGTQSGQVIMLGDQAIQTEAIGPATQLQGQVVPVPQARESLGRDVIVDALNANKSLPAGSPTRQSWSTMLERMMPEAHAALQAAGVFEGNPNDALYKSDLIREFEAATEAPVYEQSLSSRLPGGKKATEDPLADTLAISWDVALRDEDTLAKNVAAMQKYPNFPKLTGKGAKSTERNAEAIITHMVDNLLWLHDHMDVNWRERARLWYDGGRRTTEVWADRYGITEMQGAAAIAVLSPQNGWFANVSQAERIMDMVFGLREYAWDDAMTAEADRLVAAAYTAAEKVAKKEAANLKSKNPEVREKAQKKIDKARASAEANERNMLPARGKTLGELLASPADAARWIRVYDQTHNSRAYRVLTPEGGAAGYVQKGEEGEAGAGDATMMWKSYSTIAKAVSVLMDGRAENVHYQIGKEHKVRNFYNNIFGPNSLLGYATIDTHAVAAALLRPLASSDVGVNQAFGGAGSSSTLATGLNGTYPIYWEAYRRAAEARGIQPRQMQSITWEAVRGLFEAAQKAGMKADANAIWERFRKGEITQQQAQQEILARAGDITAPSWTEVPYNDTPTRTYEGASQRAMDARGPVGKAEPPTTKVMFEVAPDPNDAALTAEWNALTPEERLALSQQVAANIVPQVLKELGTGGDFVMQLGGYMGATNPSMTLRLERPELALTAARLLGYALSQDSMMVVSENQIVGTDEVGAVTIELPEGYGETEISALYDRLYELEYGGEKLVGGHTTADGQMVILNYSPLSTEELGQMIDRHLGGAFEVSGNTVYSAFPTKEDYGYGIQDEPEGDTAARQSPAQRRPDSLRAEATQQLRAALDAAAGGTAGAAAGAYAQGGVNGVRPEQAGDRAGRAADAGPAPLPGAPVIEGATGPDPRLVAVAEQYARDNGIDLKRQAEYVQVDPERAARIAQAYEEMQHAPNDPAVQEAYQNLIQQTVAQYRALEAAGYKFWFIDPENDPYKSPWDAMREMRASQTMGVFPTVAGFGSGATDVDISDNPLMGDTGILWPYGSPDGELKPVLANDLFRAVHDAFGHGLEGAGFRAQGEENAWQAHIRLFTGSAKGAITSETRGQNSWLNFGPYGESNRTAKVEDTVFADQKTGLMPEWTWTEGLAGDMAEQGGELAQGPRGTFNPQDLLITLNENADLSTFLHESGHFFLEVMADLASQPNAPQQIRDDMAQVLKWFGVPDLATWNSYTLDQKRPYHEKWAESFEQYLFEGQAPSIELQPLFRRFRSWLVNVYKSLTQFMRGRNLQVNDEIRQVMGRLIATDEQIAQAEEAAGLLPDFDATNEAIEKLQSRSLKDLKWTIKARDKYIKQLTREAYTLRKDVEDEVRKEVEAEPIYRAINWLKKGETIDPETGDQIKAEKGFRLSTEGLAEIYPESMLARPDLTRLRGMTAKEGLHPDMVAEMFGFTNGDHLVRSILDAEPISSVIEGKTDRRMLERHGDLATPEAIADAANEAVHNEARARSLATELKSQAEMMNVRQDTGRTATNGRAITVNAITQAAKQFAANIAARRRVKDLRNAAWQHRSAEARAGKRWQEATAKGETENAVQAKRDQLLNNLTVKALQEAQAEAKKILEFFKRVTKDSDEKTVQKGRDPDVVNAMRAILAAYGVAPRLEKSALEYMETVGRNDPAMYGALKPVVDAALINAKPLPEMTMEELRGLNDELRSMWVLAKRSRQMEVDGNLLDIEEAADELMARMDEIGIPDEVPGERGAITDRQELGLKLQFAKSILSRVEQWAERLDGKFGGPFLRLVFQPVKDAADRYRTAKVEYRTKFTELLKGIAPQLPPGSIEAPELGYTFGNARDSGTAELLHALLHTGNDSNKRKLLLGRGWAVENADGTLNTGRWDAFISRMITEGKLTKAHYDFAQGVWDLLEEMKPLAQETHRKVFGRYFAEVTANEVVTPFGNYRGGYVPAQTDSRLVKDAKLRELAEGENESMAYAFPAAPSGFTKSRVEYNKPLLLDLRALAQHMDKVLLFSHMQGAVTDVRRLLTNKRVSYALDRIDPGAYEGMLIPWLNRAARQVVETPVVGDRKLSRFLSAARSRAGMALMFANLSNTVQQLTGFSSAAVKVKPGLLLESTAAFIADPKGVKKTVAEASPYMKDRMLNEVGAMNDAIEEILVNATLLERGQAWTQRHAYFLQAAVDNTMSPIVWTAAYNQAIEQGENERDAVRFADGVVRQTQGSTLPEDISRFESGPGYARLFTQFVSYFNMMANTNATAVKQIVDEMGLKKGAGKLLYVALAGMLAPIWVAEAIAQAFKGGPEDEEKDGWIDDWLAAVFGLGTIRGLAAQVPIVGQAAQLVVNRFNDNPADDKFSLSPAVSLIESAVSSPASVYKAVVEDGNAQKAVRDVAAAATLITGLPVYAAARPVGYLAGTTQGKIEPTGPIDLARGIVTGTASPESRAR